MVILNVLVFVVFTLATFFEFPSFSKNLDEKIQEQFAIRRDSCISAPIAGNEVKTREIESACLRKLRKQIVLETGSVELEKLRQNVCSSCTPTAFTQDVFSATCHSYCQALLPGSIDREVFNCNKASCTFYDETKIMNVVLSCGEGAQTKGYSSLKQLLQSVKDTIERPLISTKFFLDSFNEIPSTIYNLLRKVTDPATHVIERWIRTASGGGASIVDASIENLDPNRLLKRFPSMSQMEKFRAVIQLESKRILSTAKCLKPELTLYLGCYVGAATAIEIGKDAISNRGLGLAAKMAAGSTVIEGAIKDALTAMNRGSLKGTTLANLASQNLKKFSASEISSKDNLQSKIWFLRESGQERLADNFQSEVSSTLKSAPWTEVDTRLVGVNGAKLVQFPDGTKGKKKKKWK
jgi:hypothetical protein